MLRHMMHVQPPLVSGISSQSFFYDATIIHVIFVSYNVWDLYRVRAVCTSEGGVRRSSTARGCYYPMHCKKHETADLY